MRLYSAMASLRASPSSEGESETGGRLLEMQALSPLLNAVLLYTASVVLPETGVNKSAVQWAGPSPERPEGKVDRD